MRFSFSLMAVICAISSAAFAETFERPIPQPQSATAEIWFGLGSIALIAALVVVQRLVARS